MAMDDTCPWMDILCRKSKVLAKGDRLREVSSDEQEAQGRAWGHDNGYRVRHVWRELGSAWNEKRERKDFDGAVKAVLSGETQCLWVYMSDRFSRKGAEDVLKVIGKARVVFDYDDLDSSIERHRGQIIQEAERARSYSERLHTRVTDIKARQREAGEWLSGRPPYGLKVDPKTRKVSPDESRAGGGWFGSKADLMRTVFRWITEGVSARYIAALLNELRVPRPFGGRWRGGSLTLAMKSPAYVGLQVRILEAGKPTELFRDDNGNVVSIGTGLVTLAEHQAALDVMAGRNHYVPDMRRGRAYYTLTGRAKCPGCGRGMVYSAPAYKCPSRVGGFKGDCPAPAQVTASLAEAEVRRRWLDRVTALEPTDPLALIIAERWTAYEKPDETAELWEAQAELKAAQTVRARLRKQYRAGDYEGDEQGYRDDMAEVMERVRAAQSEVAEHGVTTLDMGWLMDEGLAAEAYDAADPRKRNALLSCAIETVEISKAPYRGARWKPDERIAIAWADEAA